MSEKHKDDVTGVETTGHTWDGIRELNNPLPKWWVYTFYACILWSFAYWVVMPTWPYLTGDGWTYTQGVIGYEQRNIVTNELAGKAAFGDNCAPCHGSGAQGSKGFPNLNDDDWIWGGTLDDIHTTLLHGIRWDADDETRLNIMMAYGRDGILNRSEISDVAEYVLLLSGQPHDGEAAVRGTAVFESQCVACHGDAGTGNRELGAPNLTDAIWLYGGDKEAIVETVSNGRSGVMPAWGTRLDEGTIRSLTLFVHSLGGGEK